MDKPLNKTVDAGYEERIRQAVMQYFGHKQHRLKDTRKGKSPVIDLNERFLWDDTPDKQE